MRLVRPSAKPRAFLFARPVCPSFAPVAPPATGALAFLEVLTMPTAAVVLPAPVHAWTWPVFWLVSPFLGMVVLLGVVALVTLFRAPRSEATKVLTIFTFAFVSLACRLRAQVRSSAKGIDSSRQGQHDQQHETREEDV